MDGVTERTAAIPLEQGALRSRSQPGLSGSGNRKTHPYHLVNIGFKTFGLPEQCPLLGVKADISARQSNVCF
jgi:hypothetical protein